MIKLWKLVQKWQLIFHSLMLTRLLFPNGRCDNIEAMPTSNKCSKNTNITLLGMPLVHVIQIRDHF